MSPLQIKEVQELEPGDVMYPSGDKVSMIREIPGENRVEVFFIKRVVLGKQRAVHVQVLSKERTQQDIEDEYDASPQAGT